MYLKMNSDIDITYSFSTFTTLNSLNHDGKHNHDFKSESLILRLFLQSIKIILKLRNRSLLLAAMGILQKKSSFLWIFKDFYKSNTLIFTLSWRRPLSYRNQSIDLLHKSVDWFQYDNGLRHERVKDLLGQ